MTPKQDAKATAFSMELLMPEAMVRAHAKRPLTGDRVEALAKLFEVPVVEMTLRLVRLGLIKRRVRR